MAEPLEPPFAFPASTVAIPVSVLSLSAARRALWVALRWLARRFISLALFVPRIVASIEHALYSRRAIRFKLDMLSGTQRTPPRGLQLTLAVVWAIVGGLLGRELGVLKGTAAAIENYQRCLAAPNHDAQACHKSFHKQFARNEQNAHWLPAATVGLSPIAVTWLLVWGLVALVRRLRRGFPPCSTARAIRPHRSPSSEVKVDNGIGCGQ